MRVLWIANIPSPYRIDFFVELSKLVHLVVLFEKLKASDRSNKWYKDNRSFTHVILSGLSYCSDKAISFGFLKYIFQDFDFFVVGNPSSITGLLFMLTCLITKKEYCISIDGGFPKKNIHIITILKKFFFSRSRIAFTPVKNDLYLKQYISDESRIFWYPFSSIKKIDTVNQSLNNNDKSKLIVSLGLKNLPVILTVGQFIYRKGIDLLINSWQDLSGYQLVIIGGGLLKKRYCDLILEKKYQNVTILDFVQKEDLNKYYLASDWFVLPTREDIWGLVINEALAKGLPVITTNKCNAGIELIKNHYNGFIINPTIHDLKLIFEQIKEINEDQKEIMVNNCINTAVNNTIEASANKVYEILKSI